VHRAYTYQNPKRHIPLVSLLLWHKLVAVHCFISALGLRLWSVRQCDEILTFDNFFKILYSATSKRFHVLKMYFVLDGLKINWLSSFSFPAWSKSINYIFTFFSSTEVASSPFSIVTFL